MQTKIILSLIASIFAIVSVFGLKTINELKKDKKALETQIIAINEQNIKNIKDLQIRNAEIINNNIKINDLYKKIETISKNTSDKCFNASVNDDVLQLLKDNQIQ